MASSPVTICGSSGASSTTMLPLSKCGRSRKIYIDSGCWRASPGSATAIGRVVNSRVPSIIDNPRNIRNYMHRAKVMKLAFVCQQPKRCVHVRKISRSKLMRKGNCKLLYKSMNRRLRRIVEIKKASQMIEKGLLSCDLLFKINTIFSIIY